MSDNLNELLLSLIKRAEDRGATAADAVAVDQVEGSVRVRLGEVDQIQQARQRRVGLRVLMGGSQAISASGDLRPATLDQLVDTTCAMARLTASDPNAGLPEPEECGAAHVERPDLRDSAAIGFDLQQGVEWARRAEEVAMAQDARITNSEGGEFGFAHTSRHYAASGGVAGSYQSSSFSGAVVPVAVQEGAMERDYWYSFRRHYSDLLSPEEVGKIAAARTLRRLGAVQPKTGAVPVVFDHRTASSLVGQLASALSGYSIYRGASYLREQMGQQIASELVTIVDDATLSGGMATRPYDGEGLVGSCKTIVDSGVLKSYLLDSYSARKLGMKSTGNAARSVGDAPTVSPTNFHLKAAQCNPAEQLLDGISQGFYVTELFGFGVNLTTGDYSQGASGMWIVDGKLSHPVNEATIAGNLMQIMNDIEAAGDDLNPHKSVSSPSLRIREMMVAGA
ncbi:MAG TPA: TldD/PmbA family protein [Myxococcales bacterium]|nr:TldD/PmbA family protein [Myxococcales bacterium]